jgi:hypothetical protein
MGRRLGVPTLALRELFHPQRIAEWRAAIRRQRETYRGYFGRELSLARPRLFSEKMQWRKLFDLDPRYAILSDKAAVRDFIANEIGAEYLPPLLLLTDDPDAIPFDTLEPPYVFKSTHGSGQVLRVHNRTIDVAAARATMKNWLAASHGVALDEPGYVHVPRRIIAERMIRNRDDKPPLERRMFTFGGRVQLTQTIMVEGNTLRIAAYHDRDWNRLPWRGDSEPHPGPFPRPQRYNELLAVAERLGAGFDHVRVDLYDADDRVYAGELTLYSWSGHAFFTSDEPDQVLGDYWPLERPVARAAAAVLFRRREIPHPDSARTVTSTSMPRYAAPSAE